VLAGSEVYRAHQGVFNNGPVLARVGVQLGNEVTDVVKAIDVGADGVEPPRADLGFGHRHLGLGRRRLGNVHDERLTGIIFPLTAGQLSKGGNLGGTGEPDGAGVAKAHGGVGVPQGQVVDGAAADGGLHRVPVDDIHANIVAAVIELAVPHDNSDGGGRLQAGNGIGYQVAAGGFAVPRGADELHAGGDLVGGVGETDEDVAGIADLAYKVLDLHRDITGKRNGKVTVSCSFFVPKTHSPYQWYGQQDVEEIHRKQRYLKSLINNRNISYHYHDGHTGYLEAIFARGDRRLAPSVIEAWKQGCKFDGWTEYFKYDTWMQAFKDTNIDPDYYARRDRSFEEALPWEHIDDTVSKAFLQREWERAVEGTLAWDCRRKPCNGCNACPELGTPIIDYKEGGRVEKVTFGLK